MAYLLPRAHGKDNGFYSKKHPAEHELTGVAHVLTRLAHVLILFGGLMAIAWCALVVRNPSISTLLAAPVTSNPAGGTGSIWSLGRNSRRISGGGAVDIPAMASSSSGGGGGGAHQEYIAPSSIPGSRLTSADADLAFRRGFECVNERGTWQFDSTPRLLPWAVAGQHGGWQCDQPWLRENRARHTPQPSPEAAAPSAGANPPVAASASADLASSTQALAPPSAPSPPLRRLLSVDAFPSTTPSGGADDEAALPEDEEDTAETAAVDATRAAKAAPIAVAVASNGVAPLPALKTASSAPRSIAFAGETADGNSSSSSSSDGGGGGGGGSSSRYKHVAYAAADRVVMEGRGAEEWQVRPAVKYRWRLPARGAEGGCGVAWRDVECAQLAAGLTNGRGKILMVGDSLTSLAFLSFRNHMRMCAAAASAGARATHAGDTGNASTMGRNSRTSSNEGNGGSGEPLPAAPQSLVPPLPAKIEEAKLAVCAAEVRQSVMRNMHGHMLCDSVSYGNTTVATVRNDVLHTNSTRHLDFPRMVSFPWFDDVLPESDTAVLVLNRGAHYVEDEEFTEQLNRTLTRVREVAPELLIIYRSTSPGHAHCENITAPLKEPQDPASLPFHWGEFGRQNKLARQMVEALCVLALWQMNLAPSSRPDSFIKPHPTPVATVVATRLSFRLLQLVLSRLKGLPQFHSLLSFPCFQLLDSSFSLAMASSSPAEDCPEAVPEKPPDRRVRGLEFLRSSVAPVTPEPVVTAAVVNTEEIPSSSKNPQPAPNPAPAPAPFTLPPAIASSSKGPQRPPNPAPPPAPFTLPPAIPSSSKGPQPPPNPAPPPAPFTLPPAIPSSSTAPPSAVGSNGCNDATPAPEGRTAKKARTVVLRGKFQQSTLTFGGVRVAPPSAPEDSEPEPEEPQEIPVRADTNSPILSKAETVVPV
ncbi:unnamed protein product [Closterium sp. NIES-64]|nr:unnamed protein product [Closterium sp. NIES-64]